MLYLQGLVREVGNNGGSCAECFPRDYMKLCTAGAASPCGKAASSEHFLLTSRKLFLAFRTGAQGNLFSPPLNSSFPLTAASFEGSGFFLSEMDFTPGTLTR